MKNLFKYELFSKGLYSNWCYLESFRAMFDVGEGAATHLKNRSFGIKHLFISHTHYDHTMGIFNFLKTRVSARGDKEKELNIYAQNTSEVQKLLDLFYSTFKQVGFTINLIPIHEVQLTDKFFVYCFNTQHSKDSLGFVVRETRKRLRAEYQGLDKAELLEKKSQDPDGITESYDANMFAYILDNNGFNEHVVADCKLVIQDCTFLDSKDRTRGDTHNSFDDCLYSFYNIKPDHMILAHISSRYSRDEIEDTFKKLPNILKPQFTIVHGFYSSSKV